MDYRVSGHGQIAQQVCDGSAERKLKIKSDADQAPAGQSNKQPYNEGMNQMSTQVISYSVTGLTGPSLMRSPRF